MTFKRTILAVALLVLLPVVGVHVEMGWHEYEIQKLEAKLEKLSQTNVSVIGTIKVVGNFSPSDNCDYFVARIGALKSKSTLKSYAEEGDFFPNSPPESLYFGGYMLSSSMGSDSFPITQRQRESWKIKCADCLGFIIEYIFDLRDKGAFDPRCL